MSKNQKKSAKPHGEIRRSQLITTFGPGSMVDLPDHSVIIGGLNLWRGYKQYLIEETRLANKVKSNLIKFGHASQNTKIVLYAPPAANGDTNAGTGIQTFIFPTWFVVQNPEPKQRNGRQYQSRPLIPYKRLINGKYEDTNKKKYSVVPVRFVQACPNGHLSDLDWYGFVNTECGKVCSQQLYLEEGGTGNDFSDIFVYCEKCSKRRPLSDAKIPNVVTLGFCNGNMPWLGYGEKEPCHQPDSDKPEPNRLLVRSASNAYFGQVLSAISIPDTDQALKDAVTQVYEKYLKEANLEDIRYFRLKLPEFREALAEFEDEAIYAEVERRRSGGAEENGKSIKQLEIEIFLSDTPEIGEDKPESNFYAERRSLPVLPDILQGRLDRIVLVKRLREVMALIGFTRFEPINTNIEGELPEDAIDLRVRLAKLDRDITWVPAVENKGEGIFIAFNTEAIETWRKRAAVEQRDKELFEGYKQWCQRNNVDPETVTYPGAPYIMLHTLSHLLITTVSLACGYSASAIKERVYAGEVGYGILLHTGTNGSEGTLGGLIEVGCTIENYLKQALLQGKLCSNDPICSQHAPSDRHEERFRHGAACQGCVLIAETSCEQRNEFLDRALVIETVENHGAAFFS
ncbi:MAG: DUF1998 domain-containing protein [Chloroflexaceae bacterium]|nr:DUF1998 domain-containing protein [Chloroflexaceae bacterium]